jgi:non-ribosomal peptide synthetase component F
VRQLILHEIKPRDLVPVVTTRCIEGIVCLLAVLAAGACYIPIDAESWITDRITSTLKKLNATVLLTTTDIELPGLRILRVKERSGYSGLDNEEISVDYDTKDPAYIIFTSGTTGTPRGVMISSDALLHYVQQEPFNLAVRVGDRVQLILSIAFDGTLAYIPIFI